MNTRLSERLARFSREDVRGLWTQLRGDFDRLSGPLRRFLSGLPELFASLDEDADRRERREIYLELARFFERQSGRPLPECLGAVHLLCKEQDPVVCGDGVPHAEALAAALAEPLLKIAVDYTAKPDRSYDRRLQVFFLRDGDVLTHTVIENRPWDELPPDVRTERLQRGTQAVAFQLFTKD